MIIDISYEITNCNIYPGDPKPSVNVIKDMNNGDSYNLSTFSMCAHNGTHVDAPKHFINNGKAIDEISLEHFVGDCYVCSFNGNIDEKSAYDIINKANCKRLLIKGNCVVTSQAAKLFSNSNLFLIGIESQSFGEVDSPMEVHKILLNKNIVLLEGLNLMEANDGYYYLCAQPLNIKGIEGSPCRAILIEK